MVPPTTRDRVKYGMWGVEMGGQFFNLRWTYISNMSVLLGLEPFQKFGVGGGWWVVVKRHFRVPLWSKPWT